MKLIAAEHWICILTMIALAGALLLMRRQRGMQAAERWRERRMREELEAYARVDPTLGGPASTLDPMEAGKALAKRVCRVISEKSLFPKVAMLLRNAEGRLTCVGRVGVDDLTLGSLHAWADNVIAEERAGGPAKSIRANADSFTIQLGEWKDFDREVGAWAMAGKKERRKWRRAIVAPIRAGAGNGRIMAALVVCGDSPGVYGGLEKAMGPIELLSRRLAREMENELLRDRLLRAEKLAGLGQLAGGVAHALNNPLTAVLGFAELIAETSAEPRVRKDADTIVLEALKMKETVAKLIEFWRPVAPSDEAVSLVDILEELARACRARLEERGVTLEITAVEGVPTVRGCRDRLRQVMEHLLNNAAQAIAAATPGQDDEPHAIRVTISHDARAVHIIVSDTGTGFREPARVFDPFYTTRSPEGGAGMGLSICYGVVREHGGEISAFNLHPHGAAVVVELPVGSVVTGEEKVLRPVKQTA